MAIRAGGRGGFMRGGFARGGFARGGFARGGTTRGGLARGSIAGGRGGFRGARGGRGGRFGGDAPSKDSLDKELDSYMMKDPKSAIARLDDDLDDYMEGINATL